MRKRRDCFRDGASASPLVMQVILTILASLGILIIVLCAYIVVGWQAITLPSHLHQLNAIVLLIHHAASVQQVAILLLILVIL